MHNKIKSMYEKEMVGDDRNIIQNIKNKMKIIRKRNEKKKKLT